MVQIAKDIGCSRCGAVNKSSKAWVGEELIRRCHACGHSKVMATLSASLSDVGFTIIRAKKMPLLDLF